MGTVRSERRATPLALGYFALQVLFLCFASKAYILRIEDAYYYFGIARQVVETGRFTFDGIHLASGFQPLWEFILVFVTWSARTLGVEHRETLVTLYLLVCVALNTAAFFVLVRLGQKLFNESSSSAHVFVFAAVWFPGLTTSLLCGMENSLDWLLLLCLMLVLTGDNGRPSLASATTRRKVLLVLVSLLLVYTRLDNVVILGVAAAYFLVTERSGQTVRNVLAWGAVTFALVVPLVVWQWQVFGSPLPLSGAVKLWRTSTMVESMGVFEYSLAAVEAFALSAVAIPLAALGMGYYEIVKPLILRMGFQKVICIMGATLMLIVVGGVIVSRRLNLSVSRRSTPASLPFLGIICAVHLAVNSALFPQQWRYAGLVWYFLVEYLFLFLVLAWFLGSLFEKSSSFSARWVLRVALVLYVAAFAPMLLWRPNLPTEQQLKYLGAEWINTNLPKDALVGAFNAGVTGYYANVPVVNLDGLVNDIHFFEDYLKKNRVRDYLLDNRITHVADHWCPPGGSGWFWDWVRVPEEGEIRFSQEGNERGLSFCVIEMNKLRRVQRNFVNNGLQPHLE